LRRGRRNVRIELNRRQFQMVRLLAFLGGENACQFHEKIGVHATARRGRKPCWEVFRIPVMRYAFLLKPAAHASPDALSGRAMAEDLV
jgi:hypothetical protein